MLERTFTETNEQFHSGCALDEYNGTISVCSAQKGKDGICYLRWCFPQTKNRKPSEKPIPVRITLGDKEQAIMILKSFLKELAPNAETIEPGAPLEDDDIPF